MASTQSISASPSPPARRSRWPRCRLGPALRSTSSSRLDATNGRYHDEKGKCQMNKTKAVVVFTALLTCASAGQAVAQGPKYKSNADDIRKIRVVVEEFRQDIIHRDGNA